MEKYIKFFMEDRNGVHKRESFLKKNYPDLLDDINNNEINLNRNFPLIQKIYNHIFNLKEIPKCYCGNEVMFNETINKGYRKFCSTKCARNDETVKNQIKKTNLKLYGVESPQQNKFVRERTKQTNLKLYGVENPQQNKFVRERTKKTNLELYGVENVFESKEIQNKIKKTNLKLYGVENVSQSGEIKKKKIITSNNNYGVDYYTQTTDYHITQTNKFLSKINDIEISIDDLKKQTFLVENHCPKHKKFLIRKDTLYNRYFVSKWDNICTECSPPEQTHDSNIYNEIKAYLKLNNIEYIEKDRKLIAPYEIDLYLPKHGMGIEINGSYFHSDFFKSNNYHQKKSVMGLEKNIFIFHLWDFDFYSNKKLIFSMISSKLGILENRIYARKTKVIEINDKVCKEFLNVNHLQKWCVSKYRYGLYYNNELVSVMTFGNVRKNLNSNKSDGVFELLRFCSKQNTIVIGGAEKLMKFFERKHRPNKIISYSNLDVSSGNLYEKLMFNKVKMTKPSYWWVNHMKKYNRFSFRKDKLVRMGYDKNKSETEIMKERGFIKVYNSGNFLYEKKIV